MKTKIPIKRYIDDVSLNWEERYQKLLCHHEEETQFLISTIEKLEKELSPKYGPTLPRLPKV